jgi:tRNA-dihydrouridine synthase B
MEIFLAPMAGVTDLPFRLLVRALGFCGTAYTEMVSSAALHYNDKKTKTLLAVEKADRPLAVQIFGSNKDYMAEAARIIPEICDFDYLDINMGCPAKKIIKEGAGGALMGDIKKAEEIIRAVAFASSKPVSVKMRIGIDEDNANAIEFAKMAESAGAERICVHGRYVLQEYRGHSNWDIIKEVKKSVNIPVIGNGDIKRESNMEKIEFDNIMIGRGAYLNPALPAILEGKEVKFTKREIALLHLELIEKYRPENIGVLEARKHMMWQLGKKELNAKICRAESFNEMRGIINCA